MKKLFLISLLMLVSASGYCDDYEEGPENGEPENEDPRTNYPKKKPFKRRILHSVDGKENRENDSDDYFDKKYFYENRYTPYINPRTNLYEQDGLFKNKTKKTVIWDFLI